MLKKEFIKKIIRHDGVAEKAQPFFIAAEEGKNILVIIIHGFTSSPYHIHNIAEFMAENGYDVETVLLAGHGGSFDRLKNTNAQDWQDSVDMAIEKNINKYSKIFLIGFSFGANLALHASLKYPEIKAVTSINIPIFLKKEKRIRFFLPLARLVKQRYRKGWIPEEKWSLLKERGHHSHIPIQGIYDFYSAIDNVTKKELDKIKVPVLIIHSKSDNVSNSSSSEYLYKEISSNKKEIFILNKASHNLEHETRRDFIFQKIVYFFDNI